MKTCFNTFYFPFGHMADRHKANKRHFATHRLALDILAAAAAAVVVVVVVTSDDNLCRTLYDKEHTQHQCRKWSWLGHTLRTSVDSIVEQILQCTSQGHRGTRQPGTWKRDPEKEI